MQESTKKKEETGDVLQLVGFQIGEEEFGVEILKVQEINRMPEISPIPNSEEYVKGVINLRGAVIPVLSLRQRMGMEEIEYDNKTRVIVVEEEGKTMGLIVDQVTEVLRLSADVVEPPPSIVVKKEAAYISGVGKHDDRLVSLLDVKRLVADVDVET
jgi:purine-binding chemotaxis protein CheW